jgi:hypothetical protein
MALRDETAVRFKSRATQKTSALAEPNVTKRGSADKGRGDS